MRDWVKAVTHDEPVAVVKSLLVLCVRERVTSYHTSERYDRRTPHHLQIIYPRVRHTHTPCPSSE